MNENNNSTITSQIENIMKTTFQNLKTVADADSIVGTPINIDRETTVIPISKISFGFVGGGSDFISEKIKGNLNTVGGSGAGASISPIGFLVCGSKTIFIKIDEEFENDKWTTLLKNILTKLKN